MLEMFGAGTACVLSPISYIEYMGRGLDIPTTQQPDPLYKKFLKTLLEIQYGYIPDHPWAWQID
uniref:Uncharacterized protein n=1 Tax=Bracon brevicornis TaxID=1563983 RepID=A0A6V7K9L0_9HYME